LVMLSCVALSFQINWIHISENGSLIFMCTHLCVCLCVCVIQYLEFSRPLHQTWRRWSYFAPKNTWGYQLSVCT
jgi:hypothetical protein